jgi:hypothetical protein
MARPDLRRRARGAAFSLVALLPPLAGVSGQTRPLVYPGATVRLTAPAPGPDRYTGSSPRPGCGARSVMAQP